MFCLYTGIVYVKFSLILCVCVDDVVRLRVAPRRSDVIFELAVN